MRNYIFRYFAMKIVGDGFPVPNHYSDFSIYNFLTKSDPVSNGFAPLKTGSFFMIFQTNLRLNLNYQGLILHTIERCKDSIAYLVEIRYK